MLEWIRNSIMNRTTISPDFMEVGRHESAIKKNGDCATCSLVLSIAVALMLLFLS